MISKQNCIKSFYKTFGYEKDVRVFFAPGRVNLIGEHTDYNGGCVFPCSISIGTYVAIAKRDDLKMRFFSENLSDFGIIEHNIDELKPNTNNTWTAYTCGVIWCMLKQGFNLDCGFDMWVYGDIPNGSGLSSSASLEVATAYAVSMLNGITIDNVTIALIGQQCENEYIGMHCGIMDQFAIAMGKEGNAIYLNTSDLSFEYAPLVLDGYDILIMNTCKKRGLKDSKYNERVKECTDALNVLTKYTDAKSLCLVPINVLYDHRNELSDTVFRRARHAITEDSRVKNAVEALKKGDIIEFGKLMISSHNSLREDYEVTGTELDTLVDAALKCDGVIGARMTGAGFGGCAVSIVDKDNTESVIKYVGKIYNEKTSLSAEFYVARIGGGPSEL